MIDSPDWHKKITDRLHESAEVTRQVSTDCSYQIIAAANLIEESFRSGGKLLICGNGGSAADSQHMATELVSKFSPVLERPALPAIALTTDTSFLTAYSNDFFFDGVFERQIQALGNSGDVLLGISTSGNSNNVIRAVEKANQINICTIGLCGLAGRLNTIANVCIAVPSDNTQYIQESHICIEHILCEIVELSMFQEVEVPSNDN